MYSGSLPSYGVHLFLFALPLTVGKQQKRDIAGGNTYGGTVLSSFGGFWISLRIIFTPGGFNIIYSYGGATAEFHNAFGFFLIVSIHLVYICHYSATAASARFGSSTDRVPYLQGWFIFTFFMWLMSLRSSVAFCSLLFLLWIPFLLLAVGHLDTSYDAISGTTSPNTTLIKAGGGVGIVVAFIAWWDMLAGLADADNSFLAISVLPFPWSSRDLAKRRDCVGMRYCRCKISLV